MGWNSHPISGIFTIAYGNRTYINLFENYGKPSKSEIKVHTKTYVNADTIQTKIITKFTTF